MFCFLPSSTEYSQNIHKIININETETDRDKKHEMITKKSELGNSVKDIIISSGANRTFCELLVLSILFYDVAILLSGDIDLLESVINAKNMGKQIIVFGDESVTAEEIKRVADIFIDIHKLKEEELNKFTHISKY